ncbi:MAG: ATP synthase F1 subunit gamma [Deltaproteobacteria bacterium]|nr:ATP synthase F1 subunit gamma [Deltaproteobacteria bacterium]
MAESLRDLRRQVQAVEKTKQITRAMNMVAASKLKSAQLRMENYRPYATKLLEVLNSLALRVESVASPLLAVREPKKVRVIMMTSDRGLCGGFNTNVIKAVEGFIKYRSSQGQEVSLVTVGRKGRDYYRKKANIVGQYTDVLGSFNMDIALTIGEELIGSFVSEEYDELYVAYSEFKNVASQKPVITRLLPISSIEESEEGDSERLLGYVYEPSEEELLTHLIPVYVRVLIFRALLETSAGEHGARMVAMDNATSNCKEMIESLTLQMNKARQAAITAELMDIVGGTEALAQAK